MIQRAEETPAPCKKCVVFVIYLHGHVSVSMQAAGTEGGGGGFAGRATGSAL